MSTQTNTNNPGKTRDYAKFFKGVKSELKKVNWPSKKEVMNYTTVVVVTCTVATLGIWLADTVFGKALQLIIK